MNISLERNNRAIFLILALAVFMAYGNALFNGFVYDDGYLIVSNKFIKDFTYLDDLLLNDVASVTPIGQPSAYYRPVSMVFLAIGYKIWGLNPFGLHLNNILLHLANTLLVFILLKNIAQDQWIAFVSALLFAVHPIHVEAVTPIYNFMGLLATFFSLGAFLAFIKSDSLKNGKFLALAVLLFALALFSKEEALTLPLVFVLYDFYFISGFKFTHVLKKWKGYAWFVLAGGFYLLMRFFLFRRDIALGFWSLNEYFNILPAQNIVKHFFTIILIFYNYLVLLVFPYNLCAFHMFAPVDSLWSKEVALSTFVVAGLMVIAFYAYRKKPLMSFFIVMFFISSFMISNIIPIRGLFAERFMYFPSISFCFLFGFIFAQAFKRYGEKSQSTIKRYAAVIGIGILVFYALQAAARNYAWRTDISLWEDTIKKTPQSSRAHVNLAEAYFNYGLFNDALKEYGIALGLGAYQRPAIHNAVGRIYGDKKMYKEALREFETAIREDSRFIEPYYYAGITHLYLGDLNSASSYFEKAVRLDGKYALGYYGLGVVYEKRGDRANAAQMYSKSLELNPTSKLAQASFVRVKQFYSAK